MCMKISHIFISGIIMLAMAFIAVAGVGIESKAIMDREVYDGEKISTKANLDTLQSEHADLPVLSRGGYDFLGWNTKPDGTGVTVDEDTVFDVGSPIATLSSGIKFFDIQHLYANWRLKHYAIYYSFKDEFDHLMPEVVNPNPSSFTVEDTDLDLENAILRGYTFDKWYLNNNAVTSIPIEIGTKSITGVFTRNKHKVSFNYQGGTDGNSATSSERYVYEYSPFNKVVGTSGEESKNLPVVTKDGYDFVEWNTDSEGLGEVKTSSSLMGTNNVSLNAIWDVILYRLDYTFKCKKDNADSTITSVINDNPQYFTVEDEAISLLDPVNEKYVFDHWELAGNPVTTIDTHILTNNDLVGVFKRDVHKLTFDYNGGTFDNKSKFEMNVFEDSVCGKRVVDANNGAEADIDIPEPENGDHTFKGWNTSQDGKGIFVTAESNMFSEDTTVYAIWDDVVYDIAYDYKDDGGNNLTDVSNDNPLHYTDTTHNISLHDAQKVGYDFVKWFSDDEPITTIDTSNRKDYNVTGVFKKKASSNPSGDLPRPSSTPTVGPSASPNPSGSDLQTTTPPVTSPTIKPTPTPTPTYSPKIPDDAVPIRDKADIKVLVHTQHVEDDDYDVKKSKVTLDVNGKFVLSLKDVGVKIDKGFVMDVDKTNLVVTESSKTVDVYLNRKFYTLTYVTKYGKKTKKSEETYKFGTKVDLRLLQKLNRKTVFDGWYLDKKHLKAAKTVTMKRNTKVYGSVTDYSKYDAVVNIGGIIYAARWVPYADGTSHHVAFVVGIARRDFTSVRILDKVHIGRKTYDVTRVDPGVFKGLSYLKQVYIGQEIFMINKNSFSHCPKLKRLVIPGRQCIMIKKDSFSYNPKLTDVELQGQPYITIDKGAFRKSFKLKKVYVKARSLRMANKAFVRGVRIVRPKGLLPYAHSRNRILTETKN